jgi:hypothetical protein
MNLSATTRSTFYVLRSAFVVRSTQHGAPKNQSTDSVSIA